MDTAKQNLGKKARDKLLHLVNAARSNDPAPGVTKEAFAEEAEATGLRATAYEGASTMQDPEASSPDPEASAQQKSKGKTILASAS